MYRAVFVCVAVYRTLVTAILFLRFSKQSVGNFIIEVWTMFTRDN